MTTPPRGPIEVVRDCAATTIPAGLAEILAAGEQVQIVQTLGGSITVRTRLGGLLRVDGAEADALGLDPISEVPVSLGPVEFEMSQVMAALQRVYDPEIPVSIVELGLVYRCEELLTADGARHISIDMSMTAPGCGMGDVLRGDAARAVQCVPGVDEVDVSLVWDPPWGVSRMSEAARLQLGML